MCLPFSPKKSILRNLDKENSVQTDCHVEKKDLKFSKNLNPNRIWFGMFGASFKNFIFHLFSSIQHPQKTHRKKA